MKLIQLSLTAALALALSATGAVLAKDKKDDSPAIKAARDFDPNPYPSTYRVYPGVPTLITGATVFDGDGGRIENGQVLIADGKIVAVAGPLADMGLPAGTVRIDGTGKSGPPTALTLPSISKSVPRSIRLPSPSNTVAPISAVGNFVAGKIGEATGGEGGEMSKELTLAIYSKIGWVAIGISVVVLLLSPIVKRWMHLDTLEDRAAPDDHVPVETVA